MSTKIAVIGMGYVGIPAAALLADVDGFDVTGFQRRSKRSGWKIEVLNSGRCPFEGDEPGLDELVARVVEKGTFRVTDDYSVLKKMDIILIDVQTPTEGPDHQPLYESLKEVSGHVGRNMKKDALVITESTVAPGTTINIVLPILEKESGLTAGRDFSLAYSYERVMPGKLIEYIVNLPRIVGGIDKRSEERAVAMYSKIVKKKIYSTDVLTAETSKTMENAYRDVNIAFANEMAVIAEKLGVDIFEIQKLINSRSERHMHLPGAGVGGHCLPKDTWLLRYGLRKYWAPTMETEFVCLARKVNDLMPLHMVELIQSGLREKGKDLKGARVAILGVAYLEDSDDTRNTPAYRLIFELESRGASVIAHDPHVREFPEAELTRDLDEALKGADCAVIVTKHRPYFSLDLEKTKSLMNTPVLIDGRNVLDKNQIEAAGLIYRGIGKGK
jgi:UDP-N-acetyl-D-mannosaminuronic acid dehydrogenase